MLTVSIAGPVAGKGTGEPSAVLPSKNVMEPVGTGRPAGAIPVPDSDTWERRVIGCPKLAERVEEVKLVAVEFLLTVWETELELAV